MYRLHSYKLKTRAKITLLSQKVTPLYAWYAVSSITPSPRITHGCFGGMIYSNYFLTKPLLE